MKRIFYVMAVVLGLAMLASAQESLGDVARKQRESKRATPKKVVTNDEIPMVETPAPTAAAGEADKTADKGKEEKPATPAAGDDKAKAAASLKKGVEDQKKNIAQLEHDLDIAQREYRLKVAVYYADVGNNLRDSKKWAEDDRKQREEIDNKQKALADAKQKLGDLEEQARKAGLRTE